MDILKSISRFNKAGQGAFYTCRLIQLYNSQSFTFVYDCGTKLGGKYLVQEIETFEKLKSKKIDLLVLSHLDDDHLNHVDALLKNLSCDTVIMPYLSPLRRLFLCMRQKNLTADYISFITDPAAYLSGKVATIIYMLSSEDGNGAEDNFIARNPIPDSGSPLRLDTSRLRRIDFFDEKKPTIINVLSDVLSIEDPANVRFCFDRESVFAGMFWEFYFYNKKADESNIGSFLNFIKKEYLLDKDQINGDDIWQETLKAILNDEKRIKEVRKTFKKFFKNTNTTGLVVLHGPLNYKNEWKVTEIGKKMSVNFMAPKDCANKTLLNGDVNLNNIKYPPYITRRLPEVRYFQIPHHGSHLSWDGGVILNKIGSNYKYGEEENILCPIVNYGIGNTHGHFSEQVYEDVVTKKQCQLYLNNQFEAVEYSAMFTI